MTLFLWGLGLLVFEILVIAACIFAGHSSVMRRILGEPPLEKDTGEAGQPRDLGRWKGVTER